MCPLTILSRIAPGLLLNDELGQAQLVGSPMCINGMALLRYANDHAGIKLTKSGFLYRKCVVWAAQEFRWPDYEPEKLYELNRVLDEQDFPPLSAMHDLMLLGRLVRHTKDKAILTSSGKQVLGNFGTLQSLLFETYFTVFDFGTYERFASHIKDSDYRHFFGVVGNRLDEWTPFGDFAQWCLPIPALTNYRVSPLSDACLYLMFRLVRPLKWLGLMEEESVPKSTRIELRRIRKTLLFDQFLHFGNYEPQNLSVH